MIRSLAYMGVRSPAADAWRTFGPEVLGCRVAPDGPDGAVRLRVDEAAWRISVHPGERDDLAYLGWDTGDAAGLADVAARVDAAGLPVEHGDERLADERGVEAIAWFVDPFGFRHELVHGLATAGPFEPGREMRGFVTGEQGLGHVVLFVPDGDAADRFLRETLGLALSDTIDVGRSTMRFFHCPGHAARHHTLAVIPFPGMVGLHHLMLEVASLDDVGTALDIVNERAIPLAATLGRHTNDHMTSFYVATPSGFEIEYGTGGLVVDDAAWEVGSYDAPSLWGHRAPAAGRPKAGILRPFEPAGAPA